MNVMSDMREDEAAQPRPRKRLLIVDDDALMIALYRSIFRRHAGEFSCEFEVGGQAALARLRLESFDAMIIDWDLGGISGLDILKALRANSRTARLPVFLYTGRFDADSREQALAAGASDYASKPLDVEELLARLHALLR